MLLALVASHWLCSLSRPDHSTFPLAKDQINTSAPCSNFWISSVVCWSLVRKKMAEITFIWVELSTVIITRDRPGRGHPNTSSCYIVEGWSKDCVLLFKHLGWVSLKLWVISICILDVFTLFWYLIVNQFPQEAQSLGDIQGKLANQVHAGPIIKYVYCWWFNLSLMWQDAWPSSPDHSEN